VAAARHGRFGDRAVSCLPTMARQRQQGIAWLQYACVAMLLGLCLKADGEKGHKRWPELPLNSVKRSYGLLYGTRASPLAEQGVARTTLLKGKPGPRNSWRLRRVQTLSNE
jgi:hypothetical protein